MPSITDILAGTSLKLVFKPVAVTTILPNSQALSYFSFDFSCAKQTWDMIRDEAIVTNNVMAILIITFFITKIPFYCATIFVYCATNIIFVLLTSKKIIRLIEPFTCA